MPANIVYTYFKNRSIYSFYAVHTECRVFGKVQFSIAAYLWRTSLYWYSKNKIKLDRARTSPLNTTVACVNRFVDWVLLLIICKKKIFLKILTYLRLSRFPKEMIKLISCSRFYVRSESANTVEAASKCFNKLLELVKEIRGKKAIIFLKESRKHRDRFQRLTTVLNGLKFSSRSHQKNGPYKK